MKIEGGSQKKLTVLKGGPENFYYKYPRANIKVLYKEGKVSLDDKESIEELMWSLPDILDTNSDRSESDDDDDDDSESEMEIVASPVLSDSDSDTESTQTSVDTERDMEVDSVCSSGSRQMNTNLHRQGLAGELSVEKMY